MGVPSRSAAETSRTLSAWCDVLAQSLHPALEGSSGAKLWGGGVLNNPNLEEGQVGMVWAGLRHHRKCPPGEISLKHCHVAPEQRSKSRKVTKAEVILSKN